MIHIEHLPNCLWVSILGEFNLDDFRRFEEEALFEVRFHGAPNLLIDLRGMLDYSIDVAWEEIKFSRQHGPSLGKIALITDDQWLSWSAWLQQLLVETDLQVFEDPAEAEAWLQEETGAP